MTLTAPQTSSRKATMGRRDLARLAQRSAALLGSGTTANVAGQSVRGLNSGSHAGLLGSRGSSIRSAVDRSTPATRDALSAPRSIVSALPARQEEEASDEETMRVVGGSDSSPEVVTDHFGAISMLCDDGSAQVGLRSSFASLWMDRHWQYHGIFWGVAWPVRDCMSFSLRLLEHTVGLLQQEAGRA